MADANIWTPSSLLEQIKSEYAGASGVTSSKRLMLQNGIITALKEIWNHAPWRWRLKGLDIVTTATEGYFDLPSDYTAAYLPPFLYDTSNGSNRLYMRSRLQWANLESQYVDRGNARPVFYSLSSRTVNGDQIQTIKLLSVPDAEYTYRGFQYFMSAPTVQFSTIISFTGRPADGDKITINGRIYEFDPSDDGIDAGSQVEIDNSGSSTLTADITQAITDINADSSGIVDAAEYAGDKFEIRLLETFSYEDLTVTVSGTKMSVVSESTPNMPAIFGDVWHLAARRNMLGMLQKKQSLYAEAHASYRDLMSEAESMWDVTIIDGAQEVTQDVYNDWENMSSQRLRTGLGRMATWDGFIVIV